MQKAVSDVVQEREFCLGVRPYIFDTFHDEELGRPTGKATVDALPQPHRSLTPRPFPVSLGLTNAQVYESPGWSLSPIVLARKKKGKRNKQKGKATGKSKEERCEKSAWENRHIIFHFHPIPCLHSSCVPSEYLVPATYHLALTISQQLH